MSEADEFEPVREEIIISSQEFGVVVEHRVIEASHVRVCRTCGALVPRYASAFHTRWHRESATGRGKRPR